MNRFRLANRLALSLVVLLAVTLLSAALLWWQLPQYLQQRVNDRLVQLENHRGEIRDLKIRWLQAEVVLQQLVIRRRDSAESEAPLLNAPELVIHIHQLWPKELSASITLNAPELQLAVERSGKNSQLGLGEDWAELVDDLVPLPVRQATVHNGRIRSRLPIAEEPFSLALNNVESRIEHHENSGRFAGQLSGQLARGGELNVNIVSDAQRPGYRSTAKLSLSRTALSPYNALLRHYGGLDVSDGSYQIDLQAEVDDRQVSGSMKILLEQLDVLDFSSDAPLSWLFEGLVGGLSMLVGKGPDNEIELDIPISGELDSVEIESAGQLREQVSKLLPTLDDWKKLIPGN